VKLSLVLGRPDGFPKRITILFEGQTPVEAYDDRRYDDLDLTWTADLLAGELRVDSAEGFQWLRSARRVQLFSANPAEPDLVSVAAARSGVDHAIVCDSADVAAVRSIAQSAGSPELISYDHWQGVPEGFALLSGYIPAHAAETMPDHGFRPLDPGSGVEIILADGLAIRSRAFAEGRPPRIEINPLPPKARLCIGGQQAWLSADGGWRAPGWDSPGWHIIDVVPGPSLTYEITPDPAHGQGWPFWNAHEKRFSVAAPWSRAEICGARVMGPAGEGVLAAETWPTMIALGYSHGIAALQQRPDTGVSVALVPEPPAFLVVSSGQRRSQGRVIWLGLAGATPSAPTSKLSDPVWAEAIRRAASRHLPLEGADSVGEHAWRKAVALSRKLRKACP
jgi:hypothetical protein